MIHGMRRIGCLLVLSAIAAWTQTAETIPFRAVLSPQNEVPAVNIAATGAATVWLHVVRDAQGRVVSASTDFDVSYRFPSQVSFTGLHIHSGPAGENGPVTIDSGISAASPVMSVDGPGVVRRQGFTAPDNAAGLATVNGMLSNPAGFYVNLHTSVNPGGVIRGQLQRAEMVVLMAQLSPRNEVPAITDLNASGLGSIIALLTRDSSGNPTSGVVSFDANYTGFPEGTSFTGFHIHQGLSGVNGPVTINTGIGGGASSVPALSPGGNLHYDIEVPVDNAAAVQTLLSLFSAPDQTYMNLHTVVNPGGAIRAQLRRTDSVRFPVTMSTANEVPPIAGSQASAPAAFEAHTIRNASGAVEGAVVIFDVNHRMEGDTTFTGLHIHDGRAGENGPVTIDSGISARASVASPTGIGNIYRAVTTDAAPAMGSMNSMLGKPENHYLNLHTVTNPGGLVRSQLTAPSAAVPNVTAVISSVSDPNLRNLAPGGLMTIFGSNLMRVVTDIASAFDGNALPRSFNGTTVRIGELDAPLSFAGPGYIVAQVPFETPTGARQLTVRNANGASPPVTVQVNATAPGIFFDGQGGIFTTLFFQLVGRAGAPAARGQPVVLFSTGLATQPPAVTGQVRPYTGRPTGVVVITVGGRNATVVQSLPVPFFPGLYQTIFVVPEDLTIGTVPVQLRAGDAVSNTVNILVQ